MTPCRNAPGAAPSSRRDRPSRRSRSAVTSSPAHSATTGQLVCQSASDLNDLSRQFAPLSSVPDGFALGIHLNVAAQIIAKLHVPPAMLHMLTLLYHSVVTEKYFEHVTCVHVHILRIEPHDRQVSWSSTVMLRLTCRRHDNLHGYIFLELHKILLPFSNGNGLPHEGELKPGQEIASSQCNNRFSIRTCWNSSFFGGGGGD